jgi:hypothetical protein
MTAPQGTSSKPVEPPPAASLASVPLRKRGTAARPLEPLNRAQEQSAPPAPATMPAETDPAAIIAWWERLKRGRPFPSPDDLDRAAIAATWPDAVLLAYDASSGTISRAIRLSNADIVPNEIVEYSTMITEWLLALGRKAAQRGGALQETRTFPIGRGIADYRIDALPLASDHRGVDHVLCRLAPA